MASAYSLPRQWQIPGLPEPLSIQGSGTVGQCRGVYGYALRSRRASNPRNGTGFRLIYQLSKPSTPISGFLICNLPTSTVNHCVLSIVIATLSQHRTDLNKNRLPDL